MVLINKINEMNIRDCFVLPLHISLILDYVGTQEMHHLLQQRERSQNNANGVPL